MIISEEDRVSGREVGSGCGLRGEINMGVGDVRPGTSATTLRGFPIKHISLVTVCLPANQVEGSGRGIRIVTDASNYG